MRTRHAVKGKNVGNVKRNNKQWVWTPPTVAVLKKAGPGPNMIVRALSLPRSGRVTHGVCEPIQLGCRRSLRMAQPRKCFDFAFLRRPGNYITWPLS